MAKYDVVFSCGHEGTISIVGKTSYREWRLERCRNYDVCYDCEQKAREERNARMLAEAKEMGLPELSGTEKQVAWATTIRQKFLEEVQDHKFKSEKNKILYTDAFQEMLEAETSARYWIDIRYELINDVIRNKIIENEKKNEAVEDTLIAKQAKEEMTISADEVKHDGKVEVVVDGNSVKAIYEKNDSFIKIVKNLKFKWNGKAWERETDQFTGSAEDRAGELIAKLLKDGFRVYSSNDVIKEKAINGTYKPEILRWIIRTKDGKLGIRILDRNEDVYDKSRKLTNSKWNSDQRCVVVDASHYKEVLDFASAYGFGITNKAKEIIRTAIESENNTIKIALSEIEDVQSKSYEALDTTIKNNYNILEDLKDD